MSSKNTPPISAAERERRGHGRAKTPLLLAGVLALACAPGLLAGLVWLLWLGH